MIKQINFNESFNQFPSMNISQKAIIPVYILSQDSLINNWNNLDIKQLINRQISFDYLNSINQNSIKMNFTSNEIMDFKNKQKEFYVVDMQFLINIGFNQNIIQQSNIYYFEDDDYSQKLIFMYEGKVLEIQPTNKMIKNNDNSNMDINIKNDILRCLILLYGSEKEINKLLNSNIDDEYDLKKYYLVNKIWINYFKDKFKYKEIYKILSQSNNYNKYKDYENNLQTLIPIKDLQNIASNFVEIPNSLRNEIKLFFPQESIKKDEINMKEPPKLFQNNFELIPKSLFYLLMKLTYYNNNEQDYSYLKHIMLIGNSTLYIQDKNNLNIFYIYFYFLNKLFAIVNYIHRKYFYSEFNQHLNKEKISRYLLKKNIILNYIDISQDILNTENKKIGQIIIKTKLDESFIKTEKIKIKRDENNLIFNIYNNFNETLKKYNISQNLDLSDNNNIDKYLSQNKLIYQSVYLVEKDKLEYIKKSLNFELYEKYHKTHDNKKKGDIMNNIFNSTNPFDNGNNKIEVISDDKINYNAKYMLVDENFCKSLKILKNNSNPFIFFKNQQDFLLYCKNDKKLFILSDFSNYSFNLIECKKYKYINNILNNLIKLYNKEKEINNLLKNGQENKPIECYIINRYWLEEFKKLYNYNVIGQKIEESGNKIDNKNLVSFLGNNSLTEVLRKDENLRPKKNNLNFNNIIFPIQFQLIEKNIFDLILNDINSYYGINLGRNLMTGSIIFTNQRIYIKNNIFMIGSLLNEKEYQINYIIIPKDNIDNIINPIIVPLFGQFKGRDERFFIQMKLDLNQLKNAQNIIQNNALIGYFISISPLNYLEMNEPNHSLGLENIGATCYMNATLQCLCHIKSLKNYFRNKSQVSKDINNRYAPLTEAFNELINSLWKESSKSYFTPTRFKNLISELNPLFKGIQANDSKDLIIFIYETMHNELKNPNSNYNNSINSQNNMNIPEELKLFRNSYYPNNNSIITKIFYSEQSSRLECSYCHIAKLSFNVISFLIFPLEKVRLYLERKKFGNFENVTLDDCFEQSEENEVLCGVNQIYCNNCNSSQNAVTYNKLYNCPEVLTIILNRGKGLEFDVQFKFPMFINISKYVEDKNCNPNYELIGIITHLGESSMSGHFIAYCKSPNDNNWYCYNDAQVNKCTQAVNEINSFGIPYVLFYQKYNGSTNNENSKGNNSNNNNKKSNYFLLFLYNDKEGYIEIEKKCLLKEIISQIYNKYPWVPKKGVGFYIQRDNSMNVLDLSKGLNENNLKSGDKIIIA